MKLSEHGIHADEFERKFKCEFRWKREGVPSDFPDEAECECLYLITDLGFVDQRCDYIYANANGEFGALNADTLAFASADDAYKTAEAFRTGDATTIMHRQVTRFAPISAARELDRHPKQRGMSRNLATVVKWLRDKGYDIPYGVRLSRTRAGYWQRSLGAWSWELAMPRGSTCVSFGSRWPLSECAKAARGGTLRLHLDDTGLDVEMIPANNDGNGTP